MRIPKPIPSLYREDGSIKEVMTANYTPKNFRRIFPNQTFSVLGLFANKSTQIILYLFANADSNNMVYATYTGIARDCGIHDKKTISKVLSELRKCEVIVEVTTSHYMINPAVILQGNDQKFGLLANQFNDLLREKHTNNVKEEES